MSERIVIDANARVDLLLERTGDVRRLRASLVAALMDERPYDWLEHLQSEYKIDAHHDGDLVSLKYNQIESPMHVPIVQELLGR